MAFLRLTLTSIFAAFGAQDRQQTFLVRVEPGDLRLEHLGRVHEIAEAVLGRAAVLVQAAALNGFRGIRMRPIDRPVETVSLVFDTEEMVYLNSGCVIHSEGLSAVAGGAMEPGFFPVLDGVQAAALVGLLSDGALSSDDLGCDRHAA